MSRFLVFVMTLVVFAFTCLAGLPQGASIGITAIATGLTLSSSDIRTLSEQGPNRNMILEITNYLRVPVIRGSHFLKFGNSKYPPPTFIDRQTREAAVFFKTPHTATGVSGVLSYQIGNESFIPPCIFVLSWSVPYNYIHSRNWFGLQLMTPYDVVSWKTFDNAMSDASWETHRTSETKSFRYAYDNRPAVISCHGYVVSCTMSDYGRSIMKLSIQDGEFKNLMILL